MPSKFIRTQVVFERTGALPEDAVVNTMHWESDYVSSPAGSSDPAHWTNQISGLMSRIQTFYTGLATTWSQVLSGNVLIKVYEMDQPEPRIPYLEHPFTFTPGTGVVLPAECSAVVSLEADRQAGQPQRRRRGRIYLPPVRSAFVSFSPPQSDARISSATRTSICNAVVTMARGSTDQSFRLAVYSPTTVQLGGSLDDAFHDVTSVWMDNAFDTQRRRGMKATERTVVSVS